MAAPSFSHKEEKTFRAFDAGKGADYAKYRPNYGPKLYGAILDHHTATGGKFNSLVDVGCGPGTATRTLSTHFEHAVGLDPGQGMVETARLMGGVTSTSEPVRFEVSTAEMMGSELSPPVGEGSVDLITAATAAHWFDMPGFWARAARMLKPGGTVALWVSSSMSVDPDVPNSKAVQGALDMHEELLKDYMNAGNLMARSLYVDLQLPWTLEKPVPEFDKATFVRKEWGTDKKSDPADEFYGSKRKVDMKTMEKILGTTSPTVRWREAHPDKVGTEQDVVRLIRREVERSLQAVGVKPGDEWVTGGVKAALLLVKKSA